MPLEAAAAARDGAGRSASVWQATKAVAGDCDLLRSQLTYYTGIRSADIVAVLVHADLPDRNGPAFVCVPTTDPGAEVAEIYPMLGLRASSTITLRPADVALSEADLLGPVGAARDLMRANNETSLNPGLPALGIATVA
ncbi:hypothetical protein [Streptomyces milbemycinicus]|uniref:Uncharacterized protein n=1 Tax=Streptomyces milbemycinicus TaxID=476552 RepID=A0ABW8LS94_9ACTN